MSETSTTPDTPAARIDRALDLIEKGLKGPLTLDRIAGEACYSKYHLTRLFSELTGETVMDYVRKRRISASTKELITGTDSILSIAMAYQFESQEAYTRSFQQVLGIPPGKYRRKGNRHQVTYDRYTLSPESIKKLEKMNMEPHITEVSERKLVGMKTETRLRDNQIPRLWQTFMPRRKEVSHAMKTGFFAVHDRNPDLKMEDFTPDTLYTSWACIEVSAFEKIPEAMESRTLTGGLYAIFIHHGPAASFKVTLDFIYQQWLPASAYELDQRDQFEIMAEDYLGPNHPEAEEEVWIPIRSKNPV
jgi:AraC family transcriptional regulator